jgi:hypothetical protein
MPDTPANGAASLIRARPLRPVREKAASPTGTVFPIWESLSARVRAVARHPGLAKARSRGPRDSNREGRHVALPLGDNMQCPDALPQLSLILIGRGGLDLRAPAVPGVVGACGIGQKRKNSVDLLLLDRLAHHFHDHACRHDQRERLFSPLSLHKPRHRGHRTLRNNDG